jgi:putative transcriptional regulator
MSAYIRYNHSLKEGDIMPIKYKVNILDELKARGYSTYRLRKEKVFGERTIQQLRDEQPVSWEVICKVCSLLGCDVGDILTARAADTEGAGQ